MPIHSVTCAVILCCTLISDSHIKPVTPPHAQNWCSALWTVAVSTVLWRVLGPSQLSTLALSYDFITQQQAVVSVSVSTEQKKIHNKSMSNQVRLKERQNEKTMSLFLSGQWMYVHKAALLWKEFAFFILSVKPNTICIVFPGVWLPVVQVRPQSPQLLLCLSYLFGTNKIALFLSCSFPRLITTLISLSVALYKVLIIRVALASFLILR